MGDGLEVMQRLNLQCETVLLLGVYYHIHNQLDGVRAIRETGAHDVIIDTELWASSEKVVWFKFEDTDSLWNTPFESLPGFGKGIIGCPSRAFVQFSFQAFGYATREIDWRPLLDKWGTKGMRDYEQNLRSTFFATRKAMDTLIYPPADA